MVEIKCQACGKTSEKAAAHAKRVKYHFCNKKCMEKKSIPVTCQQCGSSFLATPRGVAAAKFCSQECMKRRNREQQVHKHGKLTEKICKTCGKLYKVRSSIARTQAHCSLACAGKSVGAKRTGKNNPKWKQKIGVVCDHCGKHFETYPSREGRRKYCSKNCRHVAHMQNMASGERTSLEKKMAAALGQARIPFQEQALFFDKFLVDFFLHKHNIIVQCDGRYWHDRPDTKSRDRGQDRYFAKAGYIVLRFDDNQIQTNIKWCIQHIRNTIQTGQIPLINY